MKEIKITVPDGMSAEWQEVDGRLILCCVDGDVPCVSADMEKKPAKDDRPVTERIKTFDDACDALGDDHQFVKNYKVLLSMATREDFMDDGWGADFVAYSKLRIITAALNEGWEPQFTEDEYRYYPYLVLWTQAEIDRMDEAERSKLLLVGGDANLGADCGVSSSYSYYGFGTSHSYIGSRLAFKTRELAEYAGRQFLALWSAFYFKPVSSAK